MSTQKGPTPSPKRGNALLKPLLVGLALLTIIVTCIAIGSSLGLSILAASLIGASIAIASFITVLAYRGAQPISRRITTKFLERLSKQPEEKREKLMADLGHALSLQWFQDPTRFKKNFKILQDQNNPELISKIATPSPLTTFKIPKNELIFMLITSFNQSEALPFIIEIIHAKLKNMNPAEIERNILILIQQSILESHELLAQKLITEWPNTDLNYKSFQRDNTLLMMLIEKSVTEKQLKIFLDLKNKEGQSLVDPDCLDANQKRTALEIALTQNPPHIKLATILKQYGAKNYGKLSADKIGAFEAAFKRSPVAPYTEQKDPMAKNPIESTGENADPNSSSKKPKSTSL